MSIEPDIGPLEADPSKISDVLTNLLANAVKFTPDNGTIRLEVRAEPPARRLDPCLGPRPGRGRIIGRSTASFRAIFHGIRHASPLVGRV